MRENKGGIKFRKVLAIFLVVLVLFVRTPLSYGVLAQSVPDAPSSPTSPSTPTTPSAPTSPSEPTAPSTPTAPSSEGETDSLEEDTGSSSVSDASNTQSAIENSASAPTNEDLSNQSASTDGTGNQTQDGQSGSTSINTGDATNDGNISTYANTNISTFPADDGSGGGISVVNSGNGTNSENLGSVNLSQDTNNSQTNSAVVGNNLNQETVTGENSASKNTGGDNQIVTGDANTTGMIVTAVNTNVDGFTVYEFNVSDEHLGDYVLDLARGTCISGCSSGPAAVINEGNGSYSDNTGNVVTDVNNLSFQLNDATLQNNLTLTSDSGDNKANMNTNGDNTIQTGDANTSGSVVNMVNNNITGNLVFAVVNIFGDLVGDIILPDGTIVSCCVGDVTAVNSGNGSGSQNTANVDQTVNNELYQFNNANIENNLVLSAETGNNDVNKNTGGNNSVATGDTNIVAQVLNVANTNLAGGDWWLVLVNEAGKWIGKIVGADGANYGGSDGFEFSVDASGEVTVANSGNGANSTNTANVSQTSNTNVNQSNAADIVNDVHLTANTGENNANLNTGGDSSIVTGDASIIANIVNFVNNNIVGGGKLFVAVVNVFGSWLGDFVGPGQSKEENSQNNTSNGQALGGLGEVSNFVEEEDPGVQDTVIVSNVVSLSNSWGSENEQEGEGRESLGIFGTASESNIQVAADTVTVDDSLTKKKVKINLAYFVYIGALFLIYQGVKKRKMLLSLLPKHNKNA